MLIRIQYSVLTRYFWNVSIQKPSARISQCLISYCSFQKEKNRMA